MGTRSTIALEYADGTVDQIYCHWDGYLDHNGRILLENYQDPFKVQAMMNLGDMSSLGEDIGGEHDFDQSTDGRECTFYGRDRGEKGTKAKRFRDFDHYVKAHQYEEYEYILRKDGQWYVSQYERDYEPLEDAIMEQMAMDDE
jgi:hypothetical protein